MKNTALASILLLSLTIVPPISAGGGTELSHPQAKGMQRCGLAKEEARQVVARGEAAPLEDILDKARPERYGEVVGIKLEQHDKHWLYEFRVVTADGHMRYLHVNARTGDYVAIEGRPCVSF